GGGGGGGWGLALGRRAWRWGRLGGWGGGGVRGGAAGWASAQAAGLLAIWGFVAGFETLWMRLTGIDPLADLRWPLMRSTWEMAMAHPWTGAGLGAWPAVYPEFARFDTGLFANQAHCDWLQWAAGGGGGLVVVLGVFLARVLPGLLRSVWGVGFLAVCVHAGIDYPFHQLPAFTTFIFCVGALAAVEGEEEERQNG
ncbi:MAG: O-antigen ligase family protein, partial [Bryobacteraceae bacterium]|nr:O-antigen ligase family protein [Bryobacteraceae bacterium]